MRVLVTGNRGRIGAVVEAELRGLGHEVRGFDVAAGDDVRDPAAVRRAVAGCRAVVHLAALANDRAGTPDDIMAVNVLGTWHILRAAEEAGVERVVHFSSAQALGIGEGERPPDYLPVDDAHPLRAGRPYGLSKRLTEELCEGFTGRTGIATICLRPFWVCDAPIYARVEEERLRDPATEWQPFWEFGAYVDLRDVATAAALAVTCPVAGHVRLLLAADDAWTTAPSREMARRLLPDVPWRGGAEYDGDPYRSLVDTRRAADVLGWRPRHPRTG